MSAVAEVQLASEVEIRPRVPADDAFIYATWLQYAKGSTPYGLGLQREAFFKAHHRFLDSVLKRPSCRVYVATPAGEPDVIAAYLVTDQIRDVPVVHFSWTKGPFRRQGLMRRLWDVSGIDFNEAIWSHPTPARDWIVKKFPGLECLEFFR